MSVTHCQSPGIDGPAGRAYAAGERTNVLTQREAAMVGTRRVRRPPVGGAQGVGEVAEVTAVPVGLAVAWLGYALWSERREPAAQPLPGSAKPQLRPTGAE